MGEVFGETAGNSPISLALATLGDATQKCAASLKFVRASPVVSCNRDIRLLPSAVNSGLVQKNKPL